MKIFRYLCMFFLVAAALSIWAALGLADGKLHIWFLDIGQGDAILMRLPAGEWVLNDGGPDDKILEWLGKLMPFYERRMLAVIVSHPHADHLNGLVNVLERYEVSNLIITGVHYDYVGYDRLKELAAHKKIKIWTIKGNGDLKIGKVGFDFIYPEENISGKSFANVNNSSIVYRLIYGNFKVFFSGDLEMEKESELVKKTKLNLNADLLKAGHHGSKTSNTLDLLKRINPKQAVISCGVDNKFKHPFPGTLENMQKVGAAIYRTDLDGTIEVIVDSQNNPLLKTMGKT